MTKLYSFEEMEEWKLYKNINTFDDQWYMKAPLRYGDMLLTCSKYSMQKFSISSASRSKKVFCSFETERRKR